MNATMQDCLLSREQAAEYLGLKPQTLAVWVSRQENGPPFIKIGRSVRYRMRDLEEWIESNTIRPEK